MPENNTPRKPMHEILESIETGIKELFASEKYAQYLRTMSRFHRYSVNNQMLIYLQRPDATLVAGFDKWQKQFGRNVKKGEKSIRIIAPTPYKKKIEQDKLDPDTKLPMRDAEGNIIGVKVTLRGDTMYEFLDRFFNVALPRVRDFRGINPNSFDGRGNYALGIKEQLIFPEIDYDKIDKLRGMDVIFVTTANTDEEARELLSLMGAPFIK